MTKLVVRLAKALGLFAILAILFHLASPLLHLAPSSAFAQGHQANSSFSTLQVYNPVPTTGSTNLTVQAGAGQSGDEFDVVSNGGGTQWLRELGGLLITSGNLQLGGGIQGVNGNATASGIGFSATFYAPAAVVVTSSSNSGVSQTLGTGHGYSGEFWTIGCNASVATAQSGGTASVSITYPDPNGTITQTVISSMSLTTKPFAQSSQTFIQLNGGSATNMSFTPTYGGTSGGTFDATCTASQVR